MAKKIIGLALIFIGFYLGAHFYIRWKNTVTDDVTKVSRMVDCQPNELRALTIEQSAEGKTERLHFDRVDQAPPGMPAATALARWEWKYSAPLGGEADPVLVRRIASTICELYDPIPMKAEDFHPETSPDRLVRRLEAKLVSDGKERNLSFEFGALADRSTVVRYRGEAGPERTFKIPDRFSQVASVAPDTFRNLRVMKIEADNVQRATLQIDGKERFTLERAGAEWKVLVAGKEKGDGAEEADRFVNRISTLRALGVESPAYTADDCRAARAKAVFSVHAIGGREEVLRFNYDRAGDVAGCSTLGTQKFRVHRDLVKYLDVPVRKVLAN